MSLVQPLTRLLTSNCCRIGRAGSSRGYSTALTRRPVKAWSPLVWGGAAAIVTSLGFSVSTVYSDANVKSIAKTAESEEKVVDPATSIAFPKTVRVPAKVPIPPLTLVGLGVRTVSFINIKVYSVGLYADLENPNLHVPRDLSPEQKIDHIVRNTACVVRIVPTRSTGFTHLRDAFTRALNTRLIKARQNGELTEEQVIQEGFPIRKLSGLFPNSPMAKHTPFDVFLTAPQERKPRALIFRDLGSVESDWVATNFVLNYIGLECPSPALKESVLQNMADFEK
ncbi:Altered inheritance of mitochondria protein 18, mitochondrial [Leucoagaricus sp. SymC.cos]|nr:Altered inheritance of mitochondria protein 18, mitochondrial [Leucoagaricus sp. SymC.cos]